MKDTYLWDWDKEIKKCYLIHRRVMERAIGRKLDNKEWVHHKDKDTLNNNIENLELVDYYQHSQIHGFHGKKGCGISILSTDPNLAWCASCKTFLPITDFNKCKSLTHGIQHYCKKCRREKYLQSKNKKREFWNI
jgi:hypothetical protein